MNNFQKLEAELAEQYDAKRRGDVQRNLFQTMGVFKFVGQIVDVYLPAMFGVLVSAAGGRTTPSPKKPGHYRSPSEGGLPPGKKGPTPPDDSIVRGR